MGYKNTLFMFRSMFFVAVSIIISVAMVLTFMRSHNRFEMIAIDKNLFIFDRKNYTLTVCDSSTCKTLPFSDDNQMFLPTTVASIPETKEIIKEETHYDDASKQHLEDSKNTDRS